MKLYKIKELTFAYPDVESEREDAFLSPALTDVTLTIKEGDFVVVAGSSGSGKTTFLRQLKTTLTPRGRQTGRILYRNETLSDMEEREQAKKIGYVAQDVDAQLVTDKVWHELAFGLESLSYDSSYIRRRVAEMSSFFGLDAIFHKKVNELSGGQKQLVNLASVMALAPEVILLDEPTSQLDPIAAQEFYGHLARVNRELGITVILSEHRLEEVYPMCTQFLLFENGTLRYDGSIREGLRTLYREAPAVTLPAATRIAFGLLTEEQSPVTVMDGREFLTDYDKKHKQVRPAEYAGGTKDAGTCERNETKGRALVTLTDLWFRYDRSGRDILRGLDLAIYQNEILAVNGSNGCGKSTLLSLLAGGCKPYRGRIRTHTKIKTGLLPQDPKLLFGKASVRAELGDLFMRSDEPDDSDGTWQKKELAAQVADFCGLTGLFDRHPYDLSGGEQQRLALAKVLLCAPDVLLLDEPTKGMDAEYKLTFARMLRELSAQGHTIVTVSHDIEFCAEVADRVCLLFDGEVATVADTKTYFTGNAFYTTAAARIAKDIVPGAVTVKDILDAYGVPQYEKPPEDRPAGLKSAGDASKAQDARGMQTGGRFASRRKGFRTGGLMHEISTGRKWILAGLTVVLAVCFYLTVRQSDLTGLIRGGAVTSDGVRYLILYGIFIAALFSVILLLRPVGRANDQRIELRKRYMGNARTGWLTIGALAAAAATIWFGKAVLSDRKYYFISLLVLLELMIPFGTALSKRRLAARDVVTIASLCALATAGRTAFYMLPNFSPVMALVMISGVAFGGEVGCVVGAVTMLASNMVFGQGPWTPWQMFAMGLVGGITGFVFRGSAVRGRTVTRLGLSAFGGLACILIYGAIMNPASVIMWQPQVNMQMILAAYVTGFPFDVVQGCATVLFLWFFARPFLEKLDRIKLKYGILL